MKKAAAIALNTIIIAAIALLVLIVLAVLIFNTSSDVEPATNCISKGGLCMADCPVDKQIVGGTCESGFCCSPV